MEDVTWFFRGEVSLVFREGLRLLWFLVSIWAILLPVTGEKWRFSPPKYDNPGWSLASEHLVTLCYSHAAWWGFPTFYGNSPLRWLSFWEILDPTSDSQRVQHMGVSKNSGTPKWMVYNGKPYKNGWFGGTIFFWKHPYGGIIENHIRLNVLPSYTMKKRQISKIQPTLRTQKHSSRKSLQQPKTWFFLRFCLVWRKTHGCWTKNRGKPPPKSSH